MGKGVALSPATGSGGRPGGGRCRASVGDGPWAPAADGRPGGRSAPDRRAGGGRPGAPGGRTAGIAAYGRRAAAGNDGRGHGNGGGHLAGAGAARRGLGRRRLGRGDRPPRISGSSPQPRQGSHSSAWRWSRTPGRTWWRSPPPCWTGWTSWSWQVGCCAAATARGWPPGPASAVRCCFHSGRGRARTSSWPASRGSGGAWVPGKATSGGCAGGGSPCGCVAAVSLPRAAAPGCCCPGTPACRDLGRAHRGEVVHNGGTCARPPRGVHRRLRGRRVSPLSTPAQAFHRPLTPLRAACQQSRGLQPRLRPQLRAFPISKLPPP